MNLSKMIKVFVRVRNNLAVQLAASMIVTGGKLPSHLRPGTFLRLTASTEKDMTALKGKVSFQIRSDNGEQN